ncbi:MAG: Sec-independent protein translocase subunit TatA [Actinomycetota bacterium]|nr:Sec-independent protein translocase subunit TatA [Actinomycetota bacterium]
MLARAFEGWHLVIIALVVLILFGSKKLPDAARSFGRSLRIFKAETKGLREDGKADTDGPADEHDAAEHVPPALPPGRNTAVTPDSAGATDSRDQR